MGRLLDSHGRSLSERPTAEPGPVCALSTSHGKEQGCGTTTGGHWAPYWRPGVHTLNCGGVTDTTARLRRSNFAVLPTSVHGTQRSMYTGRTSRGAASVTSRSTTAFTLLTPPATMTGTFFVSMRTRTACGPSSASCGGRKADLWAPPVLMAPDSRTTEDVHRGPMRLQPFCNHRSYRRTCAYGHCHTPTPRPWPRRTPP